MVGCLKAASPPPPPRAKEDPHVPGVHLRGLSVTIAAHAPGLGFSLHHQQKEAYPRTPTALQERSQVLTDLVKTSPRQGYKRCVEGEFPRQDVYGKGETEMAREEEEEEEAPRTCQGAYLNHQDAEDPKTCQGTYFYQQEDPQKPLWYLTSTTAVILFLQAIFIILFTAFVRYSKLADAGDQGNNQEPILGGNISNDNPGTLLHNQLLNMEMVVLAGIGMRLAFLREFSYSSVGGSLLVAAITLQWAILCQGALDGHELVYIDIYSMLRGCMASICVGVSHGAVLGVASPLQVIVLTLLHVPLYTITTHLASNVIQAVDRGGSVTVHMFGAVFGVSARWALRAHTSSSFTTRLASSTATQLTACLGTVVVVVYLGEVWSWSTIGDDHHRALLNTLLATLAAITLAFPASAIAHTRRKFSLSDIQCGVVGGAVAVGAVADMMVEPYGALLLGALVSVSCILTRRWLAPVLRRRLGIEDTAGVGVTHGLAGVMGGIAGVVMAAIASERGSYGLSVYQIYPAMSPAEGTEERIEVVSYLMVPAGLGRSPLLQAAHQLAALAALLVIALAGGIITGLVLRLPVCERLTQDELYNDDCYWQLPQPHSSPCHAPCHASSSDAPGGDAPGNALCNIPGQALCHAPTHHNTPNA
ncbi:ammonium transporter Rh type C-like [Procambarus clarkii]|uniref:ammonium transporter Rh type C-like n=1 Tax=Procambarus clarkii TaxID=6728 RepID=UPI0037425E86